MASKSLPGPLRGLISQTSRNGSVKSSIQQPFAQHLTRSLATETSIPSDPSIQSHTTVHPSSLPPTQIPSHIAPPTVLTTLHRFPTLEPLRFLTYPSNHLHLPLRRDVLHRAVIYEGDATRQGTAATKSRYEVHGSNRKIRPQKGTGSARLGDKKSPMLRGGGRAFAKKARDFSTDLPRKMYDLAWRTALSYRWRRGELIVIEDGAKIAAPQTSLIKEIFAAHGWGNAGGRSLIITAQERKNLFRALEGAGEDGRALVVDDVDVKDLLEMGRVVVEKGALDRILREHQSDLVDRRAAAMYD